MSRELEELQRLKKVEALLAQAQSQLDANDVTSSYKTLDSALRLDPNSKGNSCWYSYIVVVVVFLYLV